MREPIGLLFDPPDGFIQHMRDVLQPEDSRPERLLPERQTEGVKCDRQADFQG